MRTVTTAPRLPRSLTRAVRRRWRVTLAGRPPTTTRAERALRGSRMRKLRFFVQRFGLVALGAVVVTGSPDGGWPAAGLSGSAGGQADAASLKRRMSTPRV